jgi:molybdopterin adenylyltransferase
VSREKGVVSSVNISEGKGTIKKPVDKITLTNRGILNDAHAGNWHRQVSLLSLERIVDFSRQFERSFKPGEFAENITTRGIDISRVRLLDRFRISSSVLEVTQIGKDCHGGHCAVYEAVGQCVMPKEGIFCRVIKGGEIKPGDPVEHTAKNLMMVIITLSDRASSGEYEDKSGPLVESDLRDYFKDRHWNLKVERLVIPDNPAQLKKIMKRAFKQRADVIFTTGGTGIGTRDITPDIIEPMLTKPIPGIMDYIRFKYGQNKPNALLSRSMAGVRNKTIVFALPGSSKAAGEYMEEIVKVMEHCIFMIHDIDRHG